MTTRRRLALRTVDLARAAGVHPNTIRLYQARGFLPPVQRSPTGYRLFTDEHLVHARLVRMLLRERWPGRTVRASAVDLLITTAERGIIGAAVAFADHLALVRRELATAERACDVVRDWLPGPARTDSQPTGPALRPTEVAERLGITPDTLRGWERSGLHRAARDPATGARRYRTGDLDRLLVIGELRRAGYSPLAVLRMLTAADAGDSAAAVRALTDPADDENLLTASDRWVATLREHVLGAEQASGLVHDKNLQFGQPSISAPGSYGRN